MFSTLPEQHSTDILAEIEFCEFAKDYCLDLQSQLHEFRCAHEDSRQDWDDKLVVEFSATIQHLNAAAESLFHIACQH